MASTSTDNNEEDHDATMDGCWLIDGFNGMVMELDELYSREQIDGDDDSSLEQHDYMGNLQEFVDFGPTPPDHILALEQERNLSIASCVWRRYQEERCPSRIPISKLLDSEFRDMLIKKEEGTLAFKEGQYEKAIELYDEALLYNVIGPMLISPANQMQEIVAILSNTAECYLRLGKYSDAGMFATQTLLLDANHELSRIRRAKAEIVLAPAAAGRSSPHYLMQALVDIENIIKEDRSTAASDMGVSTARQLKQDVDGRLEKAKKVYLAEHPNADWAFVLRFLKSTCW